jgi:predicted RecB family nuclease
VSQSRRELDTFGHDIRRNYQSTIITKLKVRTQVRLTDDSTSTHCLFECKAADHNVCMVYQSVQSEIIAVTTKYRKEMLERKKLHNIIQDLKGNIRVFLRL